VCGKTFKLITAKHLATHGLTKEEYLEKYGYKKGTALVSKSLRKARKRKMQEMKLWERRGIKVGREAVANSESVKSKKEITKKRKTQK